MQELIEDIRDFVTERDWEQFHTPKNLAAGLTVESSELLEIFLWMTPEESRNLPMETLAKVREEIGDVMIFLLNLASKFELDPVECAKAKMVQNRQKYPAELVRGSAKKYDEYLKE